jgi:RNA polymerase sigma-70 factor (ECF subfamily)
MSRVNPIYHHSEKKLDQEQEWIALAKSDPKNFAPLYEKYHEQIFRYVNQRMDDTELAFDVTSQVFLKALKNLHKFEYRGVPLGSWLYRIAKSELNQAFRDRKAKRTINIEKTHVSTFMEVFHEEENKINKKRLFKALDLLKSVDLQLIEMRYFEDRPYKEMGEILEITENNAKVKTFRALEKLKTHFNKIYGNE